MLGDDYRQPHGACCPVRNVLRWLALPLSSDIAETLETGLQTPSRLVFMLNHIHLIVTSQDVAGFLRDFKRFTSAKFKGNLETTESSVLKLFVDAQGDYRFWMETNAPKKIENPAFYLQKLNYIHENPVRKGYVARPDHWLWVSANPASPLRTKLLG